MAETTTSTSPWEHISEESDLKKGFHTSTKRLKVHGGWLYRVYTEHREHALEARVDGQIKLSPGTIVACLEAMNFVADTGRRQEIEELEKERDMWKRRAAKHGCNVESGDHDCA